MEFCSTKIMKCIVLLSGIPGCGKTTLSRLLYGQLNTILTEGKEKTNQEPAVTREIAVVVISYDDLIPENINIDEASQQTWKVYREEIVLCIDSLLGHTAASVDNLTKPPLGVSDELWEMFYNLLQKQWISAGSIAIVIDDNMYYTSMRYRYFQLARKFTCGFCELFLACDTHLALQRNKQRENPIPEDIIVTMATKIEPPNTHENNWETNSLILNSNGDLQSHMLKISNLVRSSMMNPVQPLDEPDPLMAAESRQICSSNAIHQSDQILRKIIGKKMAQLKGSFNKAHLQHLSKQCIEARKSCLEMIRTGYVSFPVAADTPNISCDENSELYQQILRLFEQLLKEVT